MRTSYTRTPLAQSFVFLHGDCIKHLRNAISSPRPHPSRRSPPWSEWYCSRNVLKTDSPQRVKACIHSQWRPLVAVLVYNSTWMLEMQLLRRTLYASNRKIASAPSRLYQKQRSRLGVVEQTSKTSRQQQSRVRRAIKRIMKACLRCQFASRSEKIPRHQRNRGGYGQVSATPETER